MPQGHLVDVDVVLDAASNILQNDGYSAVTLQSIASLSGNSVDEVEAMFATANDAMVAMLNREFRRIYSTVVDNIERDPRGGLLSRMHTYILSGLHERPLAKALFVIDPEALNSIMRNANSFVYAPNVSARLDLIENLQNVGMVRPDVDPRQVSSILTACSAGISLTATHNSIEDVTNGLAMLLSRAVDADVEDTSPGKAVYYDWATRMALPKSEA